MSVRKSKPLDAGGLFDYAVRSLGARALTQGELKSRLTARAVRKADVDQVLARLKDHGYLNDRRFAETFSRLRLDNQGLGRYRVLRDLKGRRVAPALADQVVAEAYRGVDEGELIERFLARRIRTRPKPEALYRMLLRAGFSSGKIVEALRKRKFAPEWVEGLESAVEDDSSA